MRKIRRLLIWAGSLLLILVVGSQVWRVVDPEGYANAMAEAKAQREERARRKSERAEQRREAARAEASAAVDNQLADIEASSNTASTTEPSSNSRLESTSRPMSFAACLETIRRTASEVGVAPINIVETNEVRIVRFNTIEGSVLLSCSAPDRRMVVTRSPYQG